MRPTEVLDAQGDLLRRLTEEKDFIALTDAVGLFHDDPAYLDLDDDTKHQMMDDAHFAKQLATITRASYAYQVTPDMCRIVEAAADALDDSDKFDATQAPTGCGFARFDDGLRVKDLRGMEMQINWLVWGPGSLGTRVWMFNDTWTNPDEVDQYFQRTYSMVNDMKDEDWEYVQKVRGRWATVGTHVAFNGEELGPPVFQPNEINRIRVEDEGFVPAPGTNCTRLVQAFWLMLNQTIVETEDAKIERHGRKRAMKRAIPPQVTVIHLRRTIRAQHPENESQVEWSHRWLVRGHWAWRVCGKNHPQAQEAPVKGGIGVRVWIHPYQKGPEDAPLMITDKVYRLDH